MILKRNLVKQFTFAFFLFFSTFIFAQKQVTVSGKVVDKDAGVPLEYATITFVDPAGELSPQGGVTDTEGNFSIDVDKGTYNILVEYISFETKTFNNRNVSNDLNLGTIQLGLNTDSLDEVVVRAENTQVEVRLDKKIYNIGKDLTTRGATVSDALENIPSVTVDVEGAISLRGNQNVRILINGKPSAMAGFDDTNIFQQLPADAIERVEVITSPSARYDAEGTAGILNIILRKEKTLGLNGTINANLGVPINNSISANLNLRGDKFNIFNTTGFYYRKSPGNAFSDNTYFDNDPESYDRILEDREYDRMRKGWNTNLGIEYYITENSSITGTVFARFGDDEDVSENFNSYFYNDTGFDSRSLRTQIEGEEEETYQGAINYINNFNDEGHKLTADIQYSYDNEDKPTFINETELVPTEDLVDRERIFENEKQNEFLLQADYVYPKGEAQFEAGFRVDLENESTSYDLREFDQDINEFVIDESLSYTFDYDENVIAAYSQYGNKLGEKFSFLLGLRLEHTQLKGKTGSPYLSQEELQDELNFEFDPDFNRTYFGLFPTVNLIFEIAEEENITLGYNRRINRPRGWYINPFPSRSSRTNVFQGNPDLEPAFSNTFDLGYLKRWEKLTFNSSVYYQRETSSFERVQINSENAETEDGITQIVSLPINLSTQERIGGELGIIYNPSRKLRLNGSLNLFRFKTEGSFTPAPTDAVPEPEEQVFDATNTSFFGRFSAKYTFGKTLDVQTTGFYVGPRQTAQTDTESIFSMNLAVSKEIIKDKLTATFNVRDLFNSRKRRSFTNTQNSPDDDVYFTSDSEFQWRVRQYQVSLIYRFNQSQEDRRRNRGQRSGGGNDMEDEGEF